MEKLTEVQRISMFHTYHSAKIWIKEFGVNNLESIERDPNEVVSYNSERDMRCISTLRESKLVLTPLSEISDGDAIELAKITGWDYNNEPESEAQYDLDGLRNNIASFGDDMFDIGFDRTQQAIDHLRYKGYDLGYLHIPSLIAAGYAIDNTKI